MEHISQAAAELHITQPALSRAISRVEQEVGAQLFERGANSIRLNHTGRAFLQRVEQILAEYDDALREAADNSSVEKGSVKIMAPTLELLTGFMRSYLPRHPDMQIFHQLAGPRDTMHELETHGQILPCARSRREIHGSSGTPCFESVTVWRCRPGIHWRSSGRCS